MTEYPPQNSATPNHSMQTHEVRQWCMFMHLAQFAGYVIPLAGFVAPIVMWQMKKDEDPAIDDHGRIVVNGFLSYMIYGLIAALLCLILIGFVLLPIVGIAAIACPIIGGIKANDGELWSYPAAIKFL